MQPRSGVPYFQKKCCIAMFGQDHDVAGTGCVGDPMANRIFYQRLENETRDDRRPGLILHIKVDIEPFLITRAFDLEI